MQVEDKLKSLTSIFDDFPQIDLKTTSKEEEEKITKWITLLACTAYDKGFEDGRKNSIRGEYNGQMPNL